MKGSSCSRKARSARIFFALLAAFAAFSLGQLSAISQVPSTPEPQTTPPKQESKDANQKKQTKRILGIIPNFRAVSAGTTLPPQSVKEKFVTATQESFDYSAVFIPAAIAGIRWPPMRYRNFTRAPQDTVGTSGVRAWTRPARTTWSNSSCRSSRGRTVVTTRSATVDSSSALDMR